MGTKDNMWDRLRGGKHGQQAEAATQNTGGGSVAEPSDKSQTPASIRKGIYLSALIYIEGEQAPAANFNALAKAALTDRLAGKNSPEYAGLAMTLKKAEEQTDVAGDSGEGESGKSKKGDKFEF